MFSFDSFVGPMTLGISKASLLSGAHEQPAMVAVSGFRNAGRDAFISNVPSSTQVRAGGHCAWA